MFNTRLKVCSFIAFPLHAGTWTGWESLNTRWHSKVCVTMVWSPPFPLCVISEGHMWHSSSIPFTSIPTRRRYCPEEMTTDKTATLYVACCASCLAEASQFCIIPICWRLLFCTSCLRSSPSSTGCSAKHESLLLAMFLTIIPLGAMQFIATARKDTTFILGAIRVLFAGSLQKSANECVLSKGWYSQSDYVQ